VQASGVVPLSGRTVVDSPKNLAKVEFGYDDERLFAKLGASYVSERFFTYLNDQSVDAYTLLDLSGGWRLGDFGPVSGLALQVNVTNLLDEEYVSTIGSNGFTNSGDGQTLLAGAPRQYFLTLTGSF
jgi:iron complex outermembrane receptor protein